MRLSILAALLAGLLASPARAAPDFSSSSKSVDNLAPRPGDTLTFSLHVINNGTAANVTVQDTLPASVTYVPNSTSATAPGAPGTINVPDQNGGFPLGGSGFAIPLPLPSTFFGITVREVDFTFKATVNASAAGQICNTGNITGGGSSFAATTNPCASVPSAQLSTPELTVKVNGQVSPSSPHAAQPGDTLQFTMLIANTGSVAATGLHLHVDAPPFTQGLAVTEQGDNGATLSVQPGGANSTGQFDITNLTLPANFSLNIVWEVSAFTIAQFNAAGISSAQIDGAQLPEQGSEANSSGSLLSDDPATATSPDRTLVQMKLPRRPDFSGFIKSLAGSASRHPGDTLVYTLTIPNAGTGPATNVQLTDALDPRLVFVSAVADNGGATSFANNTLAASWSGALAAGSSDNVTLTVKLPAVAANGAQFSNQAFASATEITAPVASDDPSTPALGDPTVVTIQSAPDLSGITKTVASAAGNPPHATPGIHPGDTVVYTITVPNNGDADATQIVVTDAIDPRLSPVTPIPNGGVLSGSSISWSPATTLHPGDPPLVLTFEAVVQRPLANGTVIANQAIVSAQGVASVLSDDPATSTPHDATRFTIVSAPNLSSSTKSFVNQTRADGTFHGGDQIQFTIQPVNSGDAEASTTVISDVLDPNLDFVSASQGGSFTASTRTISWTIPKVGLDPVAPVTFIAAIHRPVADGAVISNQGRFDAAELPASGAFTNRVSFTAHSAPDLSGISKIAQVAGATVSSAVLPGTVLTYAITVPNSGDGVATNTVITDAVSSGLDNITPQDGGTLSGGTITWSVGQLGLNASAVVHFTARVRPLTANGVVISNQASVTSSEVTTPQLSDDPSTAAPHDPTKVTVSSAPDLSTSIKTVAVQSPVAPGVLRPGDTLAYTITVINSGSTYADNVVVADTIDPALTQVVAGQGGQLSNGSIQWTSNEVPALAKIAPGAANAVVLTFTAQVIGSAHDGDVISNQAQLQCTEASGFVTDDPSTTAAHDATKVTVHFPQLAFTKSLRAETPRADGSIHPGDVIDYTLTATNTGSVAATGVTVDDPLDANLDSVTAGQGGVLSAAANGAPAHLDWSSAGDSALGSLAPTASLQLTVRARVKPGTANGTLVLNQATLRANELPGAQASDDPSTQAAGDATRFQVRAIADLHTSTKVVSNNTRHDGTYRPGDSISYAIAVKNGGDAIADHVIVLDLIDAALSQITPANGGTFATGAILWNSSTTPALASMAPGAEVDLSFTAVIAATARDRQIIANQASLNFDELAGSPAQVTDDPTTSAASDPTQLTITSGPRLSRSIKTVTDVSSPGGLVRPGDILEYELTILNDGSESSTNTVLLDVPPPQTSYVAGSTKLDGQTVTDASGQSPLVTGLRIHSQRPGTGDGIVLPSSGAVPDDTAATVSFRVRVSDAAVAGTPISNQGMLRADKVSQAVTDDPSTPALGDPTVVVVGSAPLLTAEKSWSLTTDTNGNGSADVGDVITYTIEVDNRGSVASSSASIEDDLPSGATYIGGSLALNGTALTDARDGDAGEMVANHVHVALGTLAAGARAIATFRMHLDQQGTISNQAQIVDASGVKIPSDGDPTLPGIQATITPVGASGRADLSTSAKAVLDENGGDVQPGDELTYTITIVNQGGADVTDALVDDPLPPGLAYVAGSAAGDGTVAFNASPNGGGTVTSSSLTVKAGARAQIQFRARVLATVGIGSTIRNEAGVRPTPGGARLVMPAVIVVGQAQGASSITGNVSWDLDGNGQLGPADQGLGGTQVLIRRADLNGGAPVRTLISDALGNFRANDLPPANYALEALSAQGTHFADATAALAGQSGIVAQANLLVQPMGALVHSDRSAVTGARVLLLYDDSEVGQPPPACETDQTSITTGPQPLADGKTLPRPVGPSCLRQGQQAQLTGPLGLYKFDLLDTPNGARAPDAGRGSHAGTARHYRLEVLPETPLLTFPGSKPAPTDGFAGPGPVVAEGAPNGTGAPKWFQRFLLAPGELVLNNHAELDTSGLRLVKIATRTTATIGELVGYQVTLQNPSSQDLLVDATGHGGVHITDALPASFRYAAGSGHAARLVATGTNTATPGVSPAATSHCPLLAQDAQGAGCPASQANPALPDSGGKAVGSFLDFGPFDLRAGETLVLRYQTVILTSAKPGDAINSAVARAGNVNVSNSDSAVVRVAQDPLFDLASLIGKVYCASHPEAEQVRQEPGDLGVPGVRIYEDEGWFAESDAAGKFHFQGLQPGVHRFKLDPRTLPVGAEPLEDGSITTYLTRGLDARGNFPVTCQRTVSGPDRATIKAPPPPPPPPPTPPRALTVDVASLGASLDGQPLLLARGGLRLVANGEDAREDLFEAAGGSSSAPLRFETLLASGVQASSWRATLIDKAGTLLGEKSGNGPPPELIELQPSALPIGETVRAQLELSSDAGHFRSSLLPIRVVPPQPPAEVVDNFLLRGELFEEPTAASTRELARQLEKPLAAAKAKPTLRVDVEVHTSGTGSPDKELALSEQRGRVVRELLLAGGVGAERIRMHGRGNDVPLEVNVTEKARRTNRRIAIQLQKPPPAPLAPESSPVAEGIQLDQKPLVLTPGKPAALLPLGQQAQLALQRADGGSVIFLIPKEPPAPPPAPVAVKLDSAAHTLAVGPVILALPALGLGVEPLVDGEPQRRVILDAGGVPRALSFRLHAPLLDIASWRLTIASESGEQAAELSGDGPPPERLSWPLGKTLGAGILRARLSVIGRGGGEGRSPLSAFSAAPPAEPALRDAQQANALFPGRTKKLSRDGLNKTKALAVKLLDAAGAVGKIEVDVFSDNGEDARKLTEGRSADLQKALLADGIPAARLVVRAHGAVEPIASNKSPAGRRANNRVVFAAFAPPPALPEQEAMPAAVRLGDLFLRAEGDNFAGELPALPQRLPVDIHLSSGAGATAVLDLPFAAGKPAAQPLVSASTAPEGRARAATASSSTGSALIASSSATASPSTSTSPSATTSTSPSATTSTSPSTTTSTSQSTTPSTATFDDAPPLILPASSTTATATAPSAPLPSSAPDAGPAAPAPMITVAASELTPANTPIAAHLTADLPPSGATVRAEALWIRGATDPRNKLTANGTTVKLDEQGNYAVRLPLKRGEQTVALVATDPDGASATIERKLRVDPDGLFVLAVGEGDFGQSGAQLDGVGDRTDFNGMFLKGRAAGVVEGRWDTSGALGGLFQDVQLSGNFDTARRSAPDAFVELYDPSKYYPITGDSGLFGQQAASRGPVYLNLKADDSSLIVGNFKTDAPAATEQLFRFDRTLYGIDLEIRKALKQDDKTVLESRINGFVADGDLRQHHAHGELRGTGGSIYWLKNPDIIEGSEQVRLVVRDANTGLELTRIEQTRDSDYSIQAAQGRIVFKQAVPSVADASFLANANYSTPLGGNPVFVVIDYDYRGAIGDGGHAGGAHVQETLFGVVTVGGGVASENFSSGSAYTLGGLNLGFKPKPHTFLNVEVAQSSGTDAESYASNDGGLTYGSLAASCVNAATDQYACNASGRALRIELGFELNDWLDQKLGSTGSVANAMVASASNPGAPPMPTPTGIPGQPAIQPGDFLHGNAYFDTRDRGFYTSGGAMDQGATKAGVQLRWTPDLLTSVTGRVDQVSTDVALSFDSTGGFDTKRVLRRFSGIQAMRTLGEPGTLGGQITLTGEFDDTYTQDDKLGTTFNDQVVLGGLFRATPRLNLALYQEAIVNADATQYATTGDKFSTTAAASFKLNDALFAQLNETVSFSGSNSTVLGLRTSLLGPASNLYANERLTASAGAVQATSIVGAEERIASGTRMYGEYQLENQQSAANQRAVLGLMNRWEIQPGFFASVGYERAQVVGGVGLGLGGGFIGDGQNIPGATPGATLGGITGQSPTAGGSLNPVGTCIPGTTPAAGTPPLPGASSSCSPGSGLGYNPAGSYFPGTVSRDSGTLSLEFLGSERLKLSAKGELRLDQADQRQVGVIAGVANRLHWLVSLDGSGKLNDDWGAFARIHIAQTQAQDQTNKDGPQLTEAQWIELTAGLTLRPVDWDWLAVMFKATHLIDLRPLDLVSGLSDQQTSDILAVSPTFELPFHIAIAEKLAFKHTGDVLAGTPSIDTQMWLWVNRLDLHVHKLVDVSGEFRLLSLSAPGSGTLNGGDSERGFLVEVAFKPSRYARIGAGWNFTRFSDDELFPFAQNASGFFLRAVGEY